MDYEQDFSDTKVDLGVWKRLFKYSWRNKKYLFILLIRQIITALADIAYPLLQKYAVDNFALKGVTEGLWIFGIVYALTVILQASSSPYSFGEV